MLEAPEAQTAIAMTDPAANLEGLLARTAWLRQLARRLCGDHHLAEDLAQGTLAAALAAPAAPDSPAWFAGVLRNLWRRHRRREAVRRRCEAEAAGDEPLPSTADTVARVEAERLVAAEVLALEEPLRSVVLWHFFHELPVASIAARLGVPADTVHKRLQRALRRLHAHLSSRGHARCLPLLAGMPSRAVPFSFGVLLVHIKTIAAAFAAVAVLGLAVAFWPRGAADPVPPDPSGTAPLTVANAAAAESTVRDGMREMVPEVAAPATSPQPRLVAGLLVDAAGQPLAGVGLAADGTRTTSGDGGHFALACGEGERRVRVDDPGWVGVFDGRVAAAPTADPAPILVVAARRLDVRGRVIDESGAPVAGGRVQVVPDAGFLTAFVVPLDRSAPVWRDWQGRSLEDGSFTLDGAGLLPGGRVVARAPNLLPAEAAVTGSPQLVELVLRRPTADANAVLGEVLAFGVPVAGALVCLGSASTHSDADGRFRFDRREARGTELVAMRRGWQPTTAWLPAPRAGGGPLFVELCLREPTLSLAGRVVDVLGRPVAGARVWAEGGEPFPGGKLLAEAYLGGGRTNDELRARDAVSPLLALQEASPTAFWGWVRTDADGAFTLEGLCAHSYELGVLDERALGRARAGPFAAGSRGVVATFAPRQHAVVAGVVIGPDGGLRAGVDVEASCCVFTVQFGGSASRSAVRHGPVVRTDQQGCFRFAGLGAEGLFLSINGAAIVDRVVGLHEGLEGAGCGGVADLRIVVSDRTHLRVELADAGSADAFLVLDAAGDVLSLASFEDGGMTVTHRAPLSGGRSRVYAVDSSAAFVVLVREGREVTRVPVRLLPREVVVVRG